MINSMYQRMSITSSEELKEAIGLAVVGNKAIIPDIGQF